MGTLVLGVALLRAAGTQAVGWTSAAEASTSAVLMGWTTPLRAVWATLAACGGIALAWWLQMTSEPLPGLLGALLVAAPARWHLVPAWRRERARTQIERAVAGIPRGGPEWNAALADLRGAPCRIRFGRDGLPARVAFSLPPAWSASQQDDLREEVRARLSEWGRPWSVVVNRAVAESWRSALPRCLSGSPSRETAPGSGSPATHRPLAMYLREGQDGRSGEHRPVFWDPDATDPHCLVGGRTKSGKSIGLRLLVAQALLRVGR